MALDTYANLLTAIANELHRSDLTSYTPDFVTLADSRINNELRVRQMETTSASTIAAGVIAVPTNYVELKNAYITSVTPYVPLNRRTAQWIYDAFPDRSATDTPKYIAREGSNFIFGSYPDANYTVNLTYYNRFSALSSSTNSIFTSYPGLWLYGALAESAPFLKDDKRIGMWEMKYNSILAAIKREDMTEEQSGFIPMMVAG